MTGKKEQRQTSIDRFGYAINTWDLETHLRRAGVPVLSWSPTPSKRWNRSSYWFMSKPDGKVVFKERATRRQARFSDRGEEEWEEIVGWDMFAEAASALAGRGFHGPWKRPVGQAFDGLWIPAATPDPQLRRRVGDDGKSAPLRWVEGVPCSRLKLHRSKPIQDCLALATESGLCKRHQGLADRQERESAEREAAAAERKAKIDKHSARFELEVERLEEIRPLLEQLGLHPGVFEAVGPRVGDKVGVRAPAESLQELVRLAVVGFEIEEMM